ncbi:response regulator transcription factor [Bacillus sp. FSL K6-3431]|uniref:response regulator transcription factor n=1 Tax=Bacillus sp. FSL K6-3431 TaxID=2921500 RepID=UPI0030F80AFA
MIEKEYSILIVDDELPIREELRMYDWSSYGVRLMDEAENGEEALEYCTKYKPDIVITDIYMPKMNGLQFIQRFKNIHPYAQVIILTTYSEFHLVQDALKLGAVDYLLKVAVDDHELERALTKAKDAFEREKSFFERKRKEKATLFYSKLKSKVREESSYYEQVLLPFPFFIVKFFVTNIKDIESLVEQEIHDVFNQYEQKCILKIKWLPLSAGENIMIIKSKPPEEWIREIINKIKHCLEEDLFYIERETHVFAVVSKLILNPQDLLTEFKKMETGDHFGFYERPDNVYYLDGLPNDSISEEDIETIELRRSDSEVSVDDTQRFIQGHLFQWANTTRIQPDELKAMAIKWLFHWYKKFNIQEESNDIVERLWNTYTISELIGLMLHEINKGQTVKKTRWEIAQAQSLIKENIAAPLSLTFIADKVDLSSHYLSRLFREEMGESFNEYITRCRMDKAIYLLQTTNMKVYEVANCVGIPNYRYFSVVFKKKTGKTPIEYKKV